jgi:hypothetical protein
MLIEIGLNEAGEVVFQLTDDHGQVGYLTFPPDDAIRMARLIEEKAAEGKKIRRGA